ncbi:hypothetical protein F2Q69_00028144 [Brassica cretica]|uniref:Uncharacterized protein n=1 Tax=Brassica cretica TaxID=69181 RepID=A0A8S9RUT5_BRACR|nr:hypothetical protein F2Q69_00028144 [Brassica cretica]
MAEHLASIYGDRCSRIHNRPAISPTLLLSNMITPGVDPRKIQEHFEDFFEELRKFRGRLRVLTFVIILLTTT